MRPLSLALVAAFAGLVLAHTTNANAQSHICGKYETIAAKLSAQFGEKAVASGVSTNGGAYVGKTAANPNYSRWCFQRNGGVLTDLAADKAENALCGS